MKTKNEQKKGQKGITLVALVITIIVLLILSGITISALTESGLFEKVKLAKEKAENAQEKENLILQEYENIIANSGSIGTGNVNTNEKSNLLGINATSGNGTKNNPYIITEPMQFKAISLLNDTNEVYIKLERDLDFSTICYKVDGTIANDKSWEPIGNDKNQFNGILDGNGHKITNIYINANTMNQGLFNTIGINGKIKNLTIEGEINNTNLYSGVFAACNYGMIENCTNKARIKSNSAVGGIVGDNKGIIYKCINYNSVESIGETAGGICGNNASKSGNGYIIECINYGDIKAASYNVAGIVGVNAGHNPTGIGYICNCYNVGNIQGGVGRKAGILASSGYLGGNIYLFNNYNKGNVNRRCEYIL